MLDIVLAKEKFCSPIDERALLYLAIDDMDSFLHIDSLVKNTDFLYAGDAHSILFLILRELMSSGVERFDVPIIIDSAKRNNVLDNIGGIAYIQTVASIKGISKANINIYINRVLESSTKFKLYLNLYLNADNVLSKAEDTSIDSNSLIGRVESDIMDLTISNRDLSEPRDLASGLYEFLEERRNNPIELQGISTGYPILDKQIRGLVPGTLHVVAARMKMGKSTFLSNIAAHVSYKERVPTLYIDTELPFDQWRTRLLSMLTGIEEEIIIRGGYSQEQYDLIIKRCGRLIEVGGLFHSFMPAYSVENVIAMYKKYRRKHNMGFMVFDYLKEPERTSSVEKARKEYQLLGDVTTALKNLAGILNIPALTAVQLNRDNDIADSDRIARYADVVAHWQLRDKDEVLHNERCGSHKLVIKDTRRGGMTAFSGIGYWFFKDRLTIKEVPAHEQFTNDFKKGQVYNHESANTVVSYEEFADDREVY